MVEEWSSQFRLGLSYLRDTRGWGQKVGDRVASTKGGKVLRVKVSTQRVCAIPRSPLETAIFYFILILESISMRFKVQDPT